MLDLETLLSKETKFVNDFKSKEDVESEFKTAINESRFKLIYAYYWDNWSDYYGEALVLGYDLEQKQFFEVNASHCSCFGLEGQWDLEYFDSNSALSEIINIFRKRHGACNHDLADYLESLT